MRRRGNVVAVQDDLPRGVVFFHRHVGNRQPGCCPPRSAGRARGPVCRFPRWRSWMSSAAGGQLAGELRDASSRANRSKVVPHDPGGEGARRALGWSSWKKQALGERLGSRCRRGRNPSGRRAPPASASRGRADCSAASAGACVRKPRSSRPPIEVTDRIARGWGRGRPSRPAA
jgi:hypothetical protein